MDKSLINIGLSIRKAFLKLMSSYISATFAKVTFSLKDLGTDVFLLYFRLLREASSTYAVAPRAAVRAISDDELEDIESSDVHVKGTQDSE